VTAVLLLFIAAGLLIPAFVLRYPQFVLIFGSMLVFAVINLVWGVSMLATWIFFIAMSIALVVACWAKVKQGLAAAGAGAAVGLTALGIFIPSVAAATTVALPVDGKTMQLAVQSSVLMKDVPPAQSAEECATDPHYYAYDAEPGTHNFGAAISVADAKAGAQRFFTKSYCDPLWFAATLHYKAEGTELDTSKAQSDAQNFLNDRSKWAAAVEDLRNNQIESIELVDAGSVKYASLGMIPGKNPGEMPTLTKFSTQPALGQVLVVKFKDGTVRYFRVVCDLQPAEQEFPKVPQPAVPEKTPSQPPKRITVPPSSPPPSTPSTPVTKTTPSTPGTTTTVPSTTTTVPSTTTTPSTPETTTTTPSTPTTTTTPSTTTTTPSTSTSTTTTTPTCENGGTPPECHNPKGTYTYPSGKPSDNKTTGPEETTAPVQTSKADPSIKPSQERTDVPVTGATSEPRTTTPTPVHTGETSPPVDPDAAGLLFGGLGLFGGGGGMALRKMREKKGRHQ